MRRVVIASAVALVAAAGVLSAVLLQGHGSSSTGSAHRAEGRTHTSSAAPSASRSLTGPSGTPVFAFYYMWWDRQHWLSRLGPDYPVNAGTDPLPATLDPSSCGTVSNYPGNVVTDISQGLQYDQSKPQTFVDDVDRAAAAGLSGFLVNWVGTGAAAQDPTSSDYDKRLGYLFDAVHQLRAKGRRFTVILNYQSSAKLRPVGQFINDFTYFLTRYGNDAALDHTYSAKPEVVMAGTWKYSDAEIAAISKAMRSRMYLIGDEKPASWDQARADNLDGSSYYWSSQDPTKNKSSFQKLQDFATQVRQVPNPDGRPKTWLAPFTPGYNAMLLYGTPTCVPRNSGQTMRALFQGNAASKPDGWTLISWNEISEGSYIVPLTRYGTKYTDTLRTLLDPAH